MKNTISPALAWFVFANATAIAALILAVNANSCMPTGLEAIFALPLAFLIVNVTLMGPTLARSPKSIAYWTLEVFAWLRYVAAPGLQSWAGDVHAIRVSPNAGSAAIVLMVAELCLLAGVAPLLGRVTSEPIPRPQLGGGKQFYLVFLVAVSPVFLMRPDVFQQFSFFALRPGTEQRIGSAADTATMLYVYLVKIAILVAAFVAIAYASSFYEKTKKPLYFALAVVPSLVVIMIIFGERRSEQIYLAVAMGWLLASLFPDRRTLIYRAVGLVGATVIALMSIYKFFYAFVYGSYAEAVANSQISTGWFWYTLDSYVYGLNVTSMNMEFALSHSFGLDQLLFDFGRSTFGPSFLLRSSGSTTSQLFNQELYMGAQASGYLLSGIAYGVIFAGFFGAPLFSLAKFLLLVWAERRLRVARTYEAQFLWVYTTVVLSFTFFGALVIQLSTLSTTWVMFGTVFVAASLSRVVSGSSSRRAHLTNRSIQVGRRS